MSQTADNQAPPTRRPRRGRWIALAVLGVLALLSVLPLGPQHGLVRRVLVGALAQQTGREVRIDRVRDSFWRGITVDGLWIGPEAGAAGRQGVIAARRVRLRWSLLSLLWNLRDPARILTRIDVDQPDLELRRAANGEWELLRLLRPRRPRPKKPFTLGARVVVRHGTLRLVDEIAPPTPRLPNLTIDRLQGDVDFDGRGGGTVRLDAGLPGLVNRVAVPRGRLVVKPFAFEGDLDVAAVDLAGVGRVAEPYLQRWVRLTGGRLARVTGQVSVQVPAKPAGAGAEVRPPRPDVGLRLVVAADQAAVQPVQLTAPVTDLTGQVAVQLARRDGRGPVKEDGLVFTGLGATLGASRVLLDGRVTDPRRRRVLDLHARSDGLRLGELPRLLPRVRALRPLRSDGDTAFDVRLLGDLARLRAQGWVEPQRVSYGTVGGVPSGRVEFDLTRVPRGQGVAGLRGGVKLDRLAVLSPRLADAITQLSGTVRLQPDTLVLDSVRFLAGDAPVRIGGRLARLSQRRRQELALTIGVQGLRPDFAGPLLPARVRPTDVRGGLTGEVRLTGPVTALSVAGRLAVPGFRTAVATHLGGDYAFDLRLGRPPTGRVRFAGAGAVLPQLGGTIRQAAGLVTLEPGQVRLTSVRAQVAGGSVRADGLVATNGRRFDLAVHAAGVELAQVSGLTRRQGLSGRGPLFADLRLRGTPDDLAVTGSARVPWLRVPGATIQRAAGTVALRLRPRRGLLGIDGDVDLRDTTLTADARPQAPVAIARAQVRLAGGLIRARTLDVTVAGDRVVASGTVRVAGTRRVRVTDLDLRVRTDRLRDATVRRVAGPVPALRQLRLDQPVAADLRLRGSLARLQVVGWAQAPRVTVGGPSPTTAGGRATADLTFLKGRPPLGTVTLAGGQVRLAQLAEPLTAVAGTLRFAADRRVYVAEGFSARLGESRLQAAGSVGLGGPEPQLDLRVGTDRLHAADVRTALQGLEAPPEVDLDSDLGPLAVRLSGTPRRLRVATVGPRGEPGVMVALPSRLTILDYRLEGGRAGLDVLLVNHAPSAGGLDLADVAVTVPQTGSRVEVASGRIRLADGWLESAAVQATVDGSPVRLAGGVRDAATRELAFRMKATDVPLEGLLPRSTSLPEQIEGGRLSSDLTVVGPLDDLAVAGRVALGGAPELEPLQAEVHLRVVEPLPDPDPDAPPGARREILGGVRFAGGAVKLARLASPVEDLRGAATVAGHDVILHRVSARVAGSPVVLDGSLMGLPEGPLDLAVELPGNDVGRLLADLRLPPTDDPTGEPVDLFLAAGLPRLYTPRPVTGRLTLTGPLAQVAVGVDVTAPLVTLNPAQAMPDDRGLASEPAPDAAGGVVLCRDLRVTGTAVGSLRAAAEDLPDATELAGALSRLTGLTLVAAGPPDDPPAAPAAAPRPALLDTFQLGLHVESTGVDPRQGFAFLSVEAQRGILASTYSYQPAHAVVDLIGPLRALQVRGLLDVPRAELRGVPLRRLAARFDYFDHLMTLTNFVLDVRGGAVTGHGAMRLRAEAPLDLQASLHLDGVELAALNSLDTLRAKDLDVAGVASGDVVVHLAREELRAKGRVDLARLAARGQRLGDGAVDFSLDKERLLLQRLDLEDATAAAHARVKGLIGLTEDGPLDVVADVTNFELGALAPFFEATPAAGEAATAGSRRVEPPLTGRLDLVGNVRGTRRLPLVDATGTIAFGAVQGYPFHRLSLRSVPVGSQALALSATVNDAAYRLSATGTLTATNPEQREYAWSTDVDVQSLNLREVVPLAARNGSLGPSFGEVKGLARVSGRIARQPTADGGVRLNPLVDLQGTLDLAAGDRAQPGRLQLAGLDVDTARVNLLAEQDTIFIKELEVTVGETRVGVDPLAENRITSVSNDPQLAVRLTSDDLDYADLERLVGLPLQTEGFLTVTAEVAGPLRDPVADVRFNTHDLVVNGSRIGTREIKGRVARQVAVIDGTQAFELFGTKVELSGYVDQGALQANVDLEIVDVEQLRTFLASLTRTAGDRRPMAWQRSLASSLEKVPQPLTGDLRATLRLSGSKDRPRGFLLATARGLRSGDRLVPPAEVMVNVGTPQPRQPDTFEPGVCYLYGSAVVGQTAEGGSLRLQFRTADLDLAPYAPWSPRLAGLQGRLNVTGAVTGSPDEPRLEVSRLEVTDGGARGLYLASCQVASLVWQPGVLDLGRIAVRDGSLTADLSGALPLAGRSFKIRRDGDLRLQLRSAVGELAEFAEVLPGLGQAEGTAKLDLDVRGAVQAARLDGALEVDLPRVTVVERLEGEQGSHGAQPASPLDQLAGAAATPAGPAPAAAAAEVQYELTDNRLHLTLANNVLTVNECRVGAMTPQGAGGGGVGLSQRGELHVEPGGTIGQPQPVDLSQLVRGQSLLRMPMSLQVRASNFAGRSRQVRFDGVNLALDVEPVFDGRTLNRIVARRGEAWVNGGYVQLGGSLGLRNPDLGHWEDHLYDLVLSTPAVDPASFVRPASAGQPVVDASGRVTWPVALAVRGVGQARTTAAVRLVTREGQTPPLTLTGRVDVFDAEVREGALGLFAVGKKESQPKPWPASVRIDLAVHATENNWVRAKVPELQVPVRAQLKLSETPQQLRVDGTAELGEGQLNSSFLKNRISIRGGRSQFTVKRNPLKGAFEPFAGLTARAETDLLQATGGGERERYHVTLDLRGSARPGTDKAVDTEFTVKAESNPPLPEQQIFAMLSRKAEFAQALEDGKVQSFLQQEIANAAVQTALSYALTPVFDELRKAFGLDVFTIRYELDRPLEIQASKYLVKRVYLTLFVEVGGPSGTKQTVKVDYDVGRGVRVGGQFDTDSDYRLTSEYTTRF